MRLAQRWLVLLVMWIAGGCGGGMPSDAEAPEPAGEAAPEEEAAPAGEQPSTMAPAAPGLPPQAPAGAAPPPFSEVEAAEDADKTEPLDTIEQAQDLLARAEQELDSLYGQADQRKERPAGAPKPARAGAAARPPVRSRAQSPCASACRAFASLDRAAAAVCRLAGESDPRCLRARTSVKENAQRVASCNCPQSEGE